MKAALPPGGFFFIFIAIEKPPASFGCGRHEGLFSPL
jgi:hypothetical protein